MKNKYIISVLFFLIACVAISSNVQAMEHKKLVEDVKDFVLIHAPYKRYHPKTKTYEKAVMRTPAAACESIRFLHAYHTKVNVDSNVYRKIEFLSDWIIGLQGKDKNTLHYGGVPSSPDMKAPYNQLHYSIDAAFCGEALLYTYDLTKNKKYMRAAKRFGDFLETMQNYPRKKDGLSKNAPYGGFCEIVQADSQTMTCDMYVKNLLALPFLKKLSEKTNNYKYLNVAKNAREFLIKGLKSAWESASYSDIKTCRSKSCNKMWKRISGPHNEPNYYVYGDTIAYALRGLYDYEGFSNDVENLYDLYTKYKGKTPNTKKYDGEIAYAGYMLPASRSPDHFSAYYDIVTMGILHEIKFNHRKEAFYKADKYFENMNVKSLYWNKDFNFNLLSKDFIDIITLVNVAEGVINTQPR